ncbi:thiol reductant ABC exporter subunit CydC [Roseibium sp. SCPC15]|uniref:thiol reductant ABC exporter subunit CydC n=1 Tax=Roseibium sp. SCP15 TaxID=3141376 RepID=UPI0033359F8A
MSLVWQFVVSQYKHDRLHFWLGILVALLPAAAGVLLLGVSGWFITAAAIAGLSGVFLNIFVPSAIIRALAIARTAGRYGERVLTHDATFRFLTDLRNRLFAVYADRGAKGGRSALLLNRLTVDITTLDSVYLRLVVPLVLAILVAVALLAIWMSISVPLSLMGFFFLAVWAALFWFAYAGADRKTARRVDAASDAMRLRAADLAAGRRDLAIYGGLEGAADRVLAADRKLAQAEDIEERRADRLNGISLFVGQSFLAMTLFICVWSTSTGVLSVPLATGLVLVVMALPEILGQPLLGLVRLPRTVLAIRRSLATEADRSREQGGATSVGEHDASDPDKAVLRFVGVSFHYPGAKRKVLENLSMQIEPGEVVAIAGRSGCGKSTVAALASRLRVSDEGQVILKGRELALWDEQHLRRSVTVLSQRPYIFNDTVAANLRIANAEAGDSELWSALEKAALADRISKKRNGLQTVLGEGGLGLSGGECRRLALARAFLTRQDLFILDEMTEGLDAQTASDVLARFLEFRGGAAVLMIAHKKLELDAADRVVQLQEMPARQYAHPG